MQKKNTDIPENNPSKSGPAAKIVVSLTGAALRIRDKFLLPDTNWQIYPGQHWAVLGPNGAGKTTLVKALTGEVPVVRGSISYSQPLTAGYVSFEQHQHLIVREERRDASRYFSGNLEEISTVYETLIESDGAPGRSAIDVERVAARLQIEHLLERDIRVVSTGEMRKVQIARVLIQAPDILILDEPFDGLDRSSRGKLAPIIDDLMDDSRTVILVTHRQREILANISHVLAISDGKVLFQGRRGDVLTPSQMERLYPPSIMTTFSLPIGNGDLAKVDPARTDILVSMEDVRVQYGNTTVLDGLNWTMKSGENWVILGPNGCGKTTLLNLVSGDSPQAYANKIFLFGRRRGSGESIWDIKRRIGHVSSEFQIRYRKPISAFEVVLSGFFDSVGLYRDFTTAQKEIAEQWLEVLGIADKSDRVFNQLSYGEQRMLLLARSLVKMPQILILDEPCQGLDRINRGRILDAIGVIGGHSQTNIIYVTHYPDEIPAGMTGMLRFEKRPGGGFTVTRQSI
ncbi:MAG: ATP-binding cassette domain-containing protein [Desulfobacteraceae bacterium]|jgi:molybdate transport system ATP-binding protein|nr:ATP-binding cassette domain-containing protein [Desulfobacteraceae bacterium]